MYKLMMLPLLGILGAGTALAQSAPSQTQAQEVNVKTPAERQARFEARMDRMAQRLGLDAQGKAAVQATFSRYRTQMKPVWQDMHATRQALKAELAGGKDPGKLSSLTAQLTSDRQKLGSLQQAKMGELQTELTPAQYAQLVVSRHGRRFGHGHGRFAQPQE
jgi:hypothetical protein